MNEKDDLPPVPNSPTEREIGRKAIEQLRQQGGLNPVEELVDIGKRLLRKGRLLKIPKMVEKAGSEDHDEAWQSTADKNNTSSE